MRAGICPLPFSCLRQPHLVPPAGFGPPADLRSAAFVAFGVLTTYPFFKALEAVKKVEANLRLWNREIGGIADVTVVRGS